MSALNLHSGHALAIVKNAKFVNWKCLKGILKITFDFIKTITAVNPLQIMACWLVLLTAAMFGQKFRYIYK